ncbi:hypothetical protein ACFS27_03405 [Promicromonospora vindobonensis]|uniref:Minor tail protein n=1 Tax=Promicromonospora vindobonensis TaxID=195748 RepID=A0ABW5VLN1_9MICO
MPTSPDGILTVTFDPVRAAVQIQVNGSAWPAPVSRVTIMRTSPGQGAIPVRDLERRAVAGGTLLWVDNEAPLGVDVTYSCVGYDSAGDEVQVGLTNLVTDPRATVAARWAAFGGSTANESMVTGALDGPLLPNGTRSTTYARYTLTAAGTGNAQYGYDQGPGNPLPIVLAGTPLALAIYVRSSVAVSNITVRKDAYLDGAAAGGAQGGSGGSATLPANTWVRLEAVVSNNADFDQLRLGSNFPQESRFVNQVIDVALALGVPGDSTVPDYFDGDTPGAEWTGTPNASTSIRLVPTEATVSTTGAAHGLWVKIPGRADMATCVAVQDVGEMSRPTLGGSWQVPGGVAIAQSSAASLAQSAGLGSLSTALRVLSQDAGQTAALWQIIGQAPAQTVLLQTVPQPEELPSGYYQVVNPSQGTLPIRPDLYGKRPFSLPITEAVAPAGSGTGVFGATHDDIAASFTSHTEIAATVASHLELAQGAWS